MPADLHCHSIISDGSTKIEQIIKTAEIIGLDAVSITDHDDFSAYNYLQEKNLRFKIPVIKGVEISSRDFKTGRRVHILCYMPKNEEVLRSILKNTRDIRKAELFKSMEIISKHYPITFDMLESRREAYGGYFKQHVMQLLMEAGYSASIFGELFNKIFNKNTGIAPTHCVYPDIYDVLHAIKSARGIAVMAHPAVYDSFDLLTTLCKEKLIDGIEVNHPKQNKEERKYLQELAFEYGLIQTGGTDFHGYNSSNPMPLGTCTTSDQELEKLIELSQKK